VNGRRVLIIGGGISGLSTAYYLGKHGIPSILLEKSGRLGGLIRTDVVEGCQLEAGPDSYIATKPAVTELADELPALAGQVIGSNDRERRIFIVRNSGLIPMPEGMSMMVPGRMLAALRSPLIGYQTKLRFLTETRMRPRKRRSDVSISEFIGDHFGHEAVRYLTEPLLSGVFGGDSARLSARSVLPRFLQYEEKMGSLIRGVRAEGRSGGAKTSLFRSFRGGMQALTDALADVIQSNTRILFKEASQVRREENGWRVQVDGEWITGSHLVLACPAYVSAGLLAGVAPALCSELDVIPYSSAMLVSLLYRKADLNGDLRGFGFLVPRDERRTIAAATWIHRKFPSRVQPGFAAVRAFVVDPEATALAAASANEVTGPARGDLARLANFSADPVATRFYTWPRSMPQYLVGHGERVARIQALTAQQNGLYLVSNAFEGIGIPDCVRLGKETAKKIAAPNG